MKKPSAVLLSALLITSSFFFHECLEAKTGCSSTSSSLFVKACDYAVFLNAEASSDPHHLYDEKMGADSATACIVRSGIAGNFLYQVIAGREDQPITFVSEDVAGIYAEWRGSVATNFSEEDLSLKSNQATFSISNNNNASLSMIKPEVAATIADEEIFEDLAATFVGMMIGGVAAEHIIEGSDGGENDTLQPQNILEQQSPLVTTASQRDKPLLTPKSASVNRFSAEEEMNHDHDLHIVRRLFPLTPDDPRKELGAIDEAIEGVTANTAKIDINAESDASPNSSDDEFGAKTLMRKVVRYVKSIDPREYAINQDRTEEIKEEEIRANRGKYYVANFSGEYLDGFKNNLQRRKGIAQKVNETIRGTPPRFESLAIRSLQKKYENNPDLIQQEFKKLETPEKLRDGGYLSRYISIRGYDGAIKEVSPNDGSPFISTSKDVKVSVEYADHPETKEARSVAASFSGGQSALHPKYSEERNPKHRLIGFVAAIVHEANDYLDRTKADIEKLRSEGLVKAKSSRQKNDQEIIFDELIESANIAGYVPLIYPNLSKKYSPEDKELFGLEQEGRKPKPNKKSLSPHIKEYSLYRVNRSLQWRLAEKYATDKNPDAELLWVDREGRFNRFRINQQNQEK